jgi:hypothetical protein
VCDGGKEFIRRTINAECKVYETLKNNPSPFIPTIFSAEISDGKTVVCEEFVCGQDLLTADLSEKQVIRIMTDLCSALEFIHKLGIVHRDIKPSNIMLCGDGSIKLMDFEAARFVKADSDKDTRYLGTDGFAPPEQYGFSQTDFRSDIYAAGQTMKTLLGSLSAKRAYRKIIAKCTSLDPEKRYRSAGELKAALRRTSARFRISVSVSAAAAAVLAVAVLHNFLPDEAGDVSLPVMAETAESYVTSAEDIAEEPYEDSSDEYTADELIFYTDDEDAKILFAKGKSLFGEFRDFSMYTDLDGDNADEEVTVKVDMQGKLSAEIVSGQPSDGVWQSIDCVSFTVPYEFDQNDFGEDTVVQVTSFNNGDKNILAFTVGDRQKYNFTGYFIMENGVPEFAGSAWGETYARSEGFALNEYFGSGSANVYVFTEDVLSPVTAYDYSEYNSFTDGDYSVDDIFEYLAKNPNYID